MPGAFISFEGIDGSGKSTQLRLLADALHRQGFDTVVTREPGGTSLGHRLRAALLDPGEQVDPLAELLVFAADRAQHVNSLVRPALLMERIVLSDRYADSTFAYQGAGRGCDAKVTGEIVHLATGGLKPDITFIIDLPVELAMLRTRSRIRTRETGDRLDGEDSEFYKLVRNCYLEMAAKEPARIRLINAIGTIEETHQQVLKAAEAFLNGHGQ